MNHLFNRWEKSPQYQFLGMEITKVNYIAYEQITLTDGRRLPVHVHYYVVYRGYRFFIHQSKSGWGAEYVVSELETGVPALYLCSEITTGAYATEECFTTEQALRKLRYNLDTNFTIFEKEVARLRKQFPDPFISLPIMCSLL